MKKNPNCEMVLEVCILVFLMANVVMTLRLSLNMRQSSMNLEPREQLPCKAIAIRFVIEEPDCANKPLRSMQVTNLSIFPVEALDSLLNATIRQ